MSKIEKDANRHAIRRARVGVWDWNLLDDTCTYSDSWFEMLGYAPGELAQASDLWIQLAHPEDVERAVASGDRHLSGEVDEIETELRLRHKSGEWIWVLDRGGIVERDANGTPTRMVGVQTDITQQKRTALQLQEVNERFRLALEASELGIWQFDLATQQSYWDARTRQIFGLPHGDGEIDRETWHRFLHPEDKERIERSHDSIGGDTVSMKYRIVLEDGSVRHVETFARLVQIDGASGRQIGTIRDVTEEELHRDSLHWAANHDAMTGLLNRKAFEQKLTECIADSEHHPVALLFIDLDHFKVINDTAGHAAGDTILRKLADILTRVADGGALGRLGGDEFALLMAGDDLEARTRALRILGLVNDYNASSGLQSRVSVSIGIAAISDPAMPVTDALARADDACYAAKAAGRNCWSAFTESGPTSSGLTAARLVSDLDVAKRDGRLRLFGQKVLTLAPGAPECSYIEVLSRLNSTSGRSIPPVEFVSAAERFGLASALDRWVFRTALTRFAGTLAHTPLAFNFSAQTVSSLQIWDFVEQAMAEAGVDPNRIWFELTETSAITNPGAAESFMRAARASGCRIALDDFGAGLSSFSYLQKFDVDAIKIDGSLVSGIAVNRLNREIVSSLRRIAETIGCDLIAEKVEDEETLRVLQELGVPRGQGYFLHMPEALDGFAASGGIGRAVSG